MDILGNDFDDFDDRMRLMVTGLLLKSLASLNFGTDINRKSLDSKDIFLGTNAYLAF